MKGVWILLGIIAVSVFFCGIVPGLMAGQGIAVALPVIMVPGEKVWEDFVGIKGLTITNTLIATLLTDVVVLLFAFGATRQMKTIPGRLQGLFEVITGLLYGLAKNTAGANAKKVFPLMATIFLFLLIANWIKLIPSVESVGLMHCAEDGMVGYEKVGNRLDVRKTMDRGVRATEENYNLCHHKEDGAAHHDPTEEIVQSALLTAAAQELKVESVSLKDDVGNGSSIAAYVGSNGGSVEAVQTAAVALVVEELNKAAEAGTVSAEEAATVIDNSAEVVAEVVTENYYRDDLYIVTPFLRGATTDLNLTLALGLLAFIAIQYFGVSAHGIRYFTKFVNTPALENAGKNPMGIMDFAVGLLEIISEISKILSFGFRLFGNLFAGGVLLVVMSFMLSMLVPAGVYALELFVGLIQAFVFSMLLLVFSSMAMAGHGHDESH
ncbi:MAG: F0F1 ATP synthase subunit A [Chloroflexi bacterium]|nr:F0F1 ATP synthase subunit A [Chloroflexota bacterium]